MHLPGNEITGYVGQSRSRHATHTWNVTRLSDFDHGGVRADQRTPEQEVLDALQVLNALARGVPRRHAERRAITVAGSPTSLWRA